MGTLALYGNTFDNGDSLVVEYDTWDVNLPYGNGEDDYVMNSGVDLLYLSSNLWDDNEQSSYPATGFSTLMIALTLTECHSCGEIEFLTNQSNPFQRLSIYHLLTLGNVRFFCLFMVMTASGISLGHDDRKFHDQGRFGISSTFSIGTRFLRYPSVVLRLACPIAVAASSKSLFFEDLDGSCVSERVKRLVGLMSWGVLHICSKGS